MQDKYLVEIALEGGMSFKNELILTNDDIMAIKQFKVNSINVSDGFFVFNKDKVIYINVTKVVSTKEINATVEE